MQVITRTEGIEMVGGTNKYIAEYKLLEEGMALVFDEYPTKFLTSCYQRYKGRFHCKKRLQPDKATFTWVCFIDDESTDNKSTDSKSTDSKPPQLQDAASQPVAVAAA